jgi:hypothetical protein
MNKIKDKKKKRKTNARSRSPDRSLAGKRLRRYPYMSEKFGGPKLVRCTLFFA